MSALDLARARLQRASTAFHSWARKHGRVPPSTSQVGREYAEALERCARLERQALGQLRDDTSPELTA